MHRLLHGDRGQGYHCHPMLEQKIQQHFIDSADLKYQCAQPMEQPIAAAVQALLVCITGGGKILTAGAGVCVLHAQWFASLCVQGFERERPELAALALQPSMGAEGIGPQFLAQQVRALGHAGDVLLLFSVQGQEPGLLAALEVAQERDMVVIAMTGARSGSLGAQMREMDVLVAVPHERPARVHEVHGLIVHCLCDGIDAQLLGEQELL